MSYISNPNSYFSMDPVFALGIAPARSASAPLPQLFSPEQPTVALYPAVSVSPMQGPRMPCLSRAAFSSIQAARAAWARRAQSTPVEGHRSHHRNVLPGPAFAHRSISVHPSTKDSPSPQRLSSPQECAQIERLMGIRTKKVTEIRRDILAQQLSASASPAPAANGSEVHSEPPQTPSSFFDLAFAGIEMMLQDCRSGKKVAERITT